MSTTNIALGIIIQILALAYFFITVFTNEDGDHACDFCKANMSICSDSDKNHACDICAKAMSQCEDSNSDHVCEYCNKKISECEDIDIVALQKSQA